MTETFTQFDYLLNAFELASQASEPAKHGYAEKRRALFAYVRGLEAIPAIPGASADIAWHVDELRAERAEESPDPTPSPSASAVTPDFTQLILHIDGAIAGAVDNDREKSRRCRALAIQEANRLCTTASAVTDAEAQSLDLRHAFALGRCAALHELHIDEDAIVADNGPLDEPCTECRARAATVYPLPDFASRRGIVAAPAGDEAERAVEGIADYGWTFDGQTTFTINCVTVDEARRLHALFDAALNKKLGALASVTASATLRAPSERDPMNYPAWFRDIGARLGRAADEDRWPRVEAKLYEIADVLWPDGLDYGEVASRSTPSEAPGRRAAND